MAKEYFHGEKITNKDLPKFLYHGSSGDFDSLENRGEGVHLTVAPGLASAFVIPREDVTKGRRGKIRVAQSIWGNPLTELRKPISHHTVSILPRRGKNSIVGGEQGTSSGYVYKVETDKIRNQLSPNPNDPREIIFTGGSIPIKDKTPVTVTWETKENPAIKGGPGRNTFAKSLLKTAMWSGFADELEKIAISFQLPSAVRNVPAVTKSLLTNAKTGLGAVKTGLEVLKRQAYTTAHSPQFQHNMYNLGETALQLVAPH